jgi:tRNA A37 threonylcarbamoyltransferase TsaD
MTDRRHRHHAGTGTDQFSLVGLSFAKAMAFALKKPLVPINTRGHICSAFIGLAEVRYPLLALPFPEVTLADFLSSRKVPPARTRDDAAGKRQTQFLDDAIGDPSSIASRSR